MLKEICPGKIAEKTRIRSQDGQIMLGLQRGIFRFVQIQSTSSHTSHTNEETTIVSMHRLWQNVRDRKNS